MGNLPSNVGHDRPLGSVSIRSIRYERTDGRTKATHIAAFLTERGDNNYKLVKT